MNPFFHLFLTFGFVMCNHSLFWFILICITVMLVWFGLCFPKAMSFTGVE